MFFPKAKRDAPRSSLLLIAVLLVSAGTVVWLMMFLRSSMTASGRSPGQKAQLVPPSEISLAPSPSVPGGTETVLDLPPQLPGYLTDPATLRSVTDHTGHIEFEPLMCLLYQAWQLRSASVQKKLESGVAWDQLAKSPAEFRGRLVPVKGRVATGQPSTIDLPDEPGRLVPMVFRTDVYDENFNPYVVLSAEEPVGYESADTVDVAALFLKMGEEPQGSAARAPA